MTLDWFTFAAQIVNFLILVFLLKHFLYDRIIAAMDRREEKIADRLNRAREKEEEAGEEKRKFEKKSRELKEEKDRELEKAAAEARNRRDAMIKEAGEEVERKKKEWLAALGRRKSDFLDDFRRRSAESIYGLTRRMIEDLARRPLEEEVIAVFLQRYREEDGEREKMISAARDSKSNLTVTTVFDLSKANKAEIAGALSEEAGEDLKINFSTNPELICGIEVKGGGYKIAWSVDYYLDFFEEEMKKFLEETAGGGGETNDEKKKKEEDGSDV